MLYTESRHEILRKVMRNAGLREMRYRFDFEGTKIIVNLMDGSFPRSTSTNGSANRYQHAAVSLAS